jgi:hypothetical protein
MQASFRNLLQPEGSGAKAIVRGGTMSRKLRDYSSIEVWDQYGKGKHRSKVKLVPTFQIKREG